MARNVGSDYIPTKAELMREESERKAYVAANPVKLNKYDITYTINGFRTTERVSAVTNSTALDEFRRQCNMVGWIPYDVVCIEVKED